MGYVLVLIVMAVALLAAGWRFSNMIIYPDTKTPEALYASELELQRFDPAEFAAWPKEEVRIRSPYGYELFGLYLPQEHAHKTVIIAHGITVNHYCSLKYAPIFRRLGFNLLLIDHRNHGYSGGHTTTFGFYEKYDLKAWVDWVIARAGAERFSAECVVGTHGESLGAATVLQHAAIDSRLAFVIADCPYANDNDEFAYRLKVEYHLPGFPLLPVASLITKLRTGYAFGEAAPLKTIGQVTAPVLFIHGQADDYIPPAASVALHAAKPGQKQLYLAPGAGHAEALTSNPATYEAVVREFLAEMRTED